MRPLVVACLAFSLATASQQAISQPDTRSAQQDAADGQFTEQLRAYDARFFAHDYTQALLIAQKLEPTVEGTGARAVAIALQASALLGLGRETEAKQLIARAERLAPNDPYPIRSLFLGGLVTAHSDVAADALDRLIALAPDVVRDLNWESVRYFLTHEPKGEEQRNDDRRIALARIGYGGDTEGGHWRAANAVNILVKRGDSASAVELLQYVREPEAFENMLIQKRYSALWPTLERLGGPHLENVRAAAVSSAERAYVEAPDDHEKLQNYVNALRHAGRIDDAIALRSKLPETREQMAEADEQMGWAVNNVAFALYHAGRHKEADRLLELLNHAPMSEARWRVSMIINRLEMLVTGGDFEQAATLLAETEASARVDGSDYARQLVRRLQYCTLSRLGRTQEAANIRPAMLAHAQDALEPTISGLLCAGDADAAEQLTLQTLDDSKLDQAKREQFEEEAVRALQPVPLISDDPSVWDNAWRQLRQRPAIAKEFDRLGRDMPAELLPEKTTAVAAKKCVLLLFSMNKSDTGDASGGARPPRARGMTACINEGDRGHGGTVENHR